MDRERKQGKVQRLLLGKSTSLLVQAEEVHVPRVRRGERRDNGTHSKWPPLTVLHLCQTFISIKAFNPQDTLGNKRYYLHCSEQETVSQGDETVFPDSKEVKSRSARTQTRPSCC